METVISMVYISKLCDACKNLTNMEVQESTTTGELTWYFTYKCRSCGSVVEGDDVGHLPEELRKLVMAEEGEWILRIDEVPKEKIKLMKILRQLLDLDLNSISGLLKTIPGNVKSGTWAEMEVIRKKLSQEGFHATIVVK